VTALVDVSYLFARNWHAQSAKAERNDAAQQVLDELSRIESYAGHAIVCLDWPPYFRTELYPAYKGQRAERSEEMKAAQRWLYAELKSAGYRVARAEGFEADDVIASLCARLPKSDASPVLIVGCDKDLFQLIAEDVALLIPANGSRAAHLVGADEVVTKFGVQPDQMIDFQTLVGDSADNIEGVPGIGAKTAARILERLGTLGYAVALAHENPQAFIERTGLKRAHLALLDHEKSLGLWRRLVTLRTDIDTLDIQSLLEPRKPEPVKVVEKIPEPDESEVEDDIEDNRESVAEPVAAAPVEAPVSAVVTTTAIEHRSEAANARSALRRGGANGAGGAAGGDWSKALEPQNIQQLVWTSERLAESGLFPKLRWQGIMAIAMMGRTMGLELMASLLNFSLVEGRPSPGWQLVLGFTKNHPACEFFQLVDTTEKHCTYKTKRRGEAPVSMTYTIEMAQQAGLVKPGSGWAKHPAAMLRKICAVHLARAVYPDNKAAGLYIPEELGSSDNAEEAA
jgi:5'-3' exonuclease